MPPKKKYNVEKVKKAVEIIGSISRLAGIIEVSQTTLYKWTWGTATPDPINCLKIQKATGGKIKARDILPDYEWDKVLPAE